MKLRVLSWNVLADAYVRNGDYTRVDPSLMLPGIRNAAILDLATSFGADVLAFQEADLALAAATEKLGWSMFWAAKEGGKPDGCLTLVRPGIDVPSCLSLPYWDYAKRPAHSGHIMQRLRIGPALRLVNTHIRWAPPHLIGSDHIGVRQARQLVSSLNGGEVAAILADCNDRPGGQVREVLNAAGFRNPFENTPTALVGDEVASLDVIAVRSASVTQVSTGIDILPVIPRWDCPSDHIPIVADIEF